jgi:hypothetical protein
MFYLKVPETSYRQQKPVYVALFYKKLDNGETKPCLLAKYLRRTSSVAYTKKKKALSKNSSFPFMIPFEKGESEQFTKLNSLPFNLGQRFGV